MWTEVYDAQLARRLFAVLALVPGRFDDLLAGQEAGVIVGEPDDIRSAFDRIGERPGDAAAAASGSG